MKSTATCSVDSCEKPAKVRGYCRNCYGRLYQAGEIEVLHPFQPPEMRACAVCGTLFQVGGKDGRQRSQNPKYCENPRCLYEGRFRRAAESNTLTEIEAAYLAGIVDGEGSIFLQGRGPHPFLRLVVGNTNMDLLEWCERKTGVGKANWTHGATERHKRSGHWLVNSGAAESVIVQIRPYLIVKWQQADMALDFMRRMRIPAERANREWQEEYRLRMAALNKRGPDGENLSPAQWALFEAAAAYDVG